MLDLPGLNRPVSAGMIWLAILMPVVQGVLAKYRGTKLIRLALLPLGMYAGFLAAFARNEHIDEVNRIRLAQVVMLWDIASSISFALASKPPTLPSPSNPYLRWLRSFSVIKSITLLISESTLNIRPHTAPPHRFTWSLYFRGIAYHLSRLVLSYLITDLATYPLWRLAPHTFGSPPMQQRDFHAWCAALSAQYGGPSWAWWVFWTWCLVIVTGSIVAMLPHLSALVFITIGFASPKEFPMVMHGPLLSSSFNEFWGKRYHQLLAPFFRTATAPIASAPKPVYLMGVFVVSGLYHMAVYYPLTYPTDFVSDMWPYALFYVGQGLGCVLEREYAKVTGKRLRGLKGWLIFWTTMILLGMPTAAREYGTGWVGVLRAQVGPPGRSPICWLAHALGLGPDPRSFPW